ncbi:DUF2442 domain-containing protein [Niabella ginsengisoli]|uniref:DUF2442 domain-containing protein n=1 Tax=Niabella ginsengisoli TaxID=522298 RepID=A0ABS9SJZ1_9BACT|nr:DUF2442 domain-containing protein [Niabella ginsengisoli]MCH5598689.1 DUF2442 domain-containing protein [Niabella ginsengisoli]
MPKIEVIKVWTDDKAIHIKTKNGAEYYELFEEYPTLKFASKKQRESFETDNIGVHWEEIDEDLSFEGFIKTAKKKETTLHKALKNIPEINISAFSRRVGMPQPLMANYISGNKKLTPLRKRK